MAYIGPEPNPGQNREVDDISSSFNGSLADFTLQVNSQNVSPGSSNAIIVSLGGVVQNPGTDYTVAASTLTFTTAPASGLSFFGLVLGQSVDTQTIGDASVTATKLASPLDLPDNQKIRFGTGNDLSVYHDASNSYIEDSGSGSLFIRGSDLILEDAGGNDYISCSDTGTGGTVTLKHNASTVFATASGGVSLTGGAAANITALSDGATITIDMATACHHSVTLGGNRTFAAPSNQVVGQAGSIFITQDGSGSRTAAFNAAFKFVGGTAPTLTTGAGLTDRIDYIIKSSNVIHCAVSLDVK